MAAKTTTGLMAMDNNQKTAYIQSQIVCANCELENLKTLKALAFEEEDAEKIEAVTKMIVSLPAKFGLTSNQVLSFLTGV